MSTSTRNEIDEHANVTSFVVQCANVVVAQKIIAYARNEMNATCVVYRSQYDNERASLRRERATMLQNIARAQMSSRNDDDNANVKRMQNEYIAFCKTHKFDIA